MVEQELPIYGVVMEHSPIKAGGFRLVLTMGVPSGYYEADARIINLGVDTIVVEAGNLLDFGAPYTSETRRVEVSLPLKGTVVGLPTYNLIVNGETAIWSKQSIILPAAAPLSHVTDIRRIVSELRFVADLLKIRDPLLTVDSLKITEEDAGIVEVSVSVVESSPTYYVASIVSTGGGWQIFGGYSVERYRHTIKVTVANLIFSGLIIQFQMIGYHTETIIPLGSQFDAYST
jgi:hypothetical protein